MRRAAALFAFGLALPAVAAAQAADPQDGLAKRQAEVVQLQQQVARQEAQGVAAEQQLQQKDQAIADLRRQLDALHGATPAAAASR